MFLQNNLVSEQPSNLSLHFVSLVKCHQKNIKERHNRNYSLQTISHYLVITQRAQWCQFIELNGNKIIIEMPK